VKKSEDDVRRADRSVGIADQGELARLAARCTSPIGGRPTYRREGRIISITSSLLVAQVFVSGLGRDRR
jgi:hypothetical protein